ncbi:hypothetical protein M0812_14170 [Anaeramoeba flamelloides]|uniref:PSI domain-containing protein n=1 Tax=Anaeramoeba flamelloides TaxID=1746091 RepID=A0AAV7ZEP7_9EUKA|nr:hypothetical protein M0812_14170 [Anaeramoeba flamelloides]
MYGSDCVFCSDSSVETSQYCGVYCKGETENESGCTSTTCPESLYNSTCDAVHDEFCNNFNSVRDCRKCILNGCQWSDTCVVSGGSTNVDDCPAPQEASDCSTPYTIYTECSLDTEGCEFIWPRYATVPICSIKNSDGVYDKIEESVGSQECSKRNDCDECLEAGCHWCYSEILKSGQCIWANETGNQCPYEVRDTCPHLCESKPNCGACLGEVNCTWCDLSGNNEDFKCFSTESNECSNQDGIVIDSCAADECDQESCYPCKNHGCSWCQIGENAICTKNDSDCIDNSGGEIVETCESTCQSYDNCDECTPENGCQYCYAQGDYRCIDIGSQCDEYGIENCTDTRICEGRNCYDCIRFEQCTWCEHANETTACTFNQMECTDAGGKAYDECPPRNCSDHTDCEECNSNSCVWCVDDSDSVCKDYSHQCEEPYTIISDCEQEKCPIYGCNKCNENECFFCKLSNGEEKCISSSEDCEGEIVTECENIPCNDVTDCDACLDQDCTWCHNLNDTFSCSEESICTKDNGYPEEFCIECNFFTCDTCQENSCTYCQFDDLDEMCTTTDEACIDRGGTVPDTCSDSRNCYSKGTCNDCVEQDCIWCDLEETENKWACTFLPGECIDQGGNNRTSCATPTPSTTPTPTTTPTTVISTADLTSKFSLIFLLLLIFINYLF